MSGEHSNSVSCDRLRVYGTEGNEFFPDPTTGQHRPDPKQWYLDGLRCYVYPDQRELMIYLGDVRHRGSLDQAFALYEGTQNRDLIEGCANAVTQCLESGRNWTLREQTGNTNEKSLYQHLTDIRRGSPSQLRVSDFAGVERELIREIFERDETKPIHVVAADYRTAARLARTYAARGDSDPRIHVYNSGTPSPPEDVDLSIGVRPGNYEVDIPEQTVERLEHYQKQYEEIRQQNRRANTVDAITTHAENEDEVSVVVEAIKEGLQNTYGQYVIQPRNEHQRIQRERSEYQERLHQAKNRIELLEEELTEREKQLDRLERKANWKKRTRAPLRLFSQGSSNSGTQFSQGEIPRDERLGSGRRAHSSSGGRSTVVRWILIGLFILAFVVVVGVLLLSFGSLPSVPV